MLLYNLKTSQKKLFDKNLSLAGKKWEHKEWIQPSENKVWGRKHSRLIHMKNFAMKYQLLCNTKYCIKYWKQPKKRKKEKKRLLQWRWWGKQIEKKNRILDPWWLNLLFVYPPFLLLLRDGSWSNSPYCIFFFYCELWYYKEVVFIIMRKSKLTLELLRLKAFKKTNPDILFLLKAYAVLS